MNRLAIIGVPRNRHTLAEAILQARLRGMEVALVDRPAALKECRTPPAVWRIPLDSPNAAIAVEALRVFAPRFVVSYSEFNLVLAAEIRERLGLPGLSPQIVRRTRDKHAARQRVQQRGLTRAAFATTTLDDLEATAARFEPPFVIKPASMTGSIGVHAVRRREDVAAFRDRFVSWETEANRDRAFVIESFIGGDEYSVEGICHHGIFHLIAVTTKFTTGFPNFAEVGHIVPAREHPGADFAGFIGRVATALELDSTPIHAEVKVSGTEIELIEIHARFGGDLIPLLVEKAFGYNVFGAYYDSLLGTVPPPVGDSRAITGIRFLHPGELEPIARSLHVRSGVDYCMQVDPAPAHGAECEADNIRILNPRIGHILFTADDQDTAEGFLADLDLDPGRQAADAGRHA